jgi:hypothetical protein
VRWQTTSLIGGTCTGSDVFSEAVLMHEGLIYTSEIFLVRRVALILFSFERISLGWYELETANRLWETGGVCAPGCVSIHPTL